MEYTRTEIKKIIELSDFENKKFGRCSGNNSLKMVKALNHLLPILELTPERELVEIAETLYRTANGEKVNQVVAKLLRDKISNDFLIDLGFSNSGELETEHHNIHLFFYDVWRLVISGKKGHTGDEIYIEDFFTKQSLCNIITSITGHKLNYS